MTPTSQEVVTAVRGTFYWTFKPNLPAAVGDAFDSSNSGFEVVYNSGTGNWDPHVDYSDTECPGQATASQSGDTVTLNITFAHGDGCNTSAMEVLVFTRGPEGVDVLDTLSWTNSGYDGEIGATSETHYHGNLLKPGEPTPTPVRTPAAAPAD